MELVAKFVPPAALPGLAALWWLCTLVIGFFGGGMIGDGLIAALAVSLAVLFYWASEPLEAIFAHWYGWNENQVTGLGQIARQYFPSGHELDSARTAAMRVLTDDADLQRASAEIEGRASVHLRERSRLRWLVAVSFGLLDRLCRGLVMMGLFAAVAAATVILFRAQTGVDISYVTLAAAMVIALAAVPLSFAGFVYCKWHHLVRLYRSVAEFEAASEAS